MTERRAGLEKTFRLLGSSSRPAAADLLRIALGQADGAVQEGAVSALLARHEPAGYEAILRDAHRLPDRVRKQIAAEGERLAPIWARILKEGETRLRRTVVELLFLHPDPARAEVIGEAMRDPDAGIRQIASRALGACAERLEPGDGRRLYVREAFAAILTDPSVNADASLLGSMLRFDPSFEFQFLRILDRPSDPRRPAIRDLLEHGNAREEASLLARMLRSERQRLRQEAMDILGARRDPPFLEHLAILLQEMPGRMVERLLTDCGTFPWSGIPVRDMPVSLRLLTARWLALAVGTIEERRRWMGRLIEEGGGEVRAFLLRRAAERSEEELQRVAEVVADDPTPEVQAALLAVSEGRDAPFWGRLLARLVNAPDEGIRTEARRRAAPAGFESYLRTFRRLDPAALGRVSAALRKIDPGIPGRLREELEAPDRERRLIAVRAAVSLGQQQALQEELIAMLLDRDAHVRSGAAAALAETRTLDAVRALARALADPDDRVRANAIEGIGRLRDARLANLLRPFLGSVDARCRANAIEALWDGLSADDRGLRLREMLAAGGRMASSALWLLGRRGAAELQVDVQRLSQVPGPLGQRARSLLARAPGGSA
ncbi:MAG: HEAT repeat domain-containing protein [Planctomycetes bacterium]|nr:HEAT repeat domain-containing protein [Planctomycetota bacterium]